MRSFLKRIVFTTLSLYGVTLLFPEVRFTNFATLITMGALLTVLHLFVRPFLQILLLPVNIITFGLFSWLVHIIILYLAVLLTPGFHIGAITIPSITIFIFVFPVFHLSLFWSFFLVSFLVSVGNNFLSWLFR